jgi:hypothetical protein
MIGKEATAALVVGGAVAGGLVIAAVARARAAPKPAAPTMPAPGVGGPWRLVQGHRYLVSLRASQTTDWSGLNAHALPAGLVFVTEVSRSNYTLSYEVDSSGNDHNEPDRTFWLGLSPPGGLDVVVADLGPSTGLSTAAPGAAPPAAPTPVSNVSGAWQQAAAIAFGERLRLVITREQLAAFAYANGIGVRPDLDAVSVRKSLEGALTVPRVQARIGTHVFFVWMPGQTLPSDWPADDAHISDGWHVEMVYGVGWLRATPLPSQTPSDLSTADLRAIALDVSMAWAPTANRPSRQTIQNQPAISWTRSTKLSKDDHMRLSVPRNPRAQINSALGRFGDAERLTLMVDIDAAAVNAVTQMLAWHPIDPLPPDWPADDTAAPSESHLEARWPFTQDLAASGSSALAWIASGAGA